MTDSHRELRTRTTPTEVRIDAEDDVPAEKPATDEEIVRRKWHAAILGAKRLANLEAAMDGGF